MPPRRLCTPDIADIRFPNDETLYWLKLLEEASMFKKGRFAELRNEANGLLSIAVAPRKTSKGIGGAKENCSPISIVYRQSTIVN